jgi:hypothetical protein
MTRCNPLRLIEEACARIGMAEHGAENDFPWNILQVGKGGIDVLPLTFCITLAFRCDNKTLNTDFRRTVRQRRHRNWRFSGALCAQANPA